MRVTPPLPPRSQRWKVCCGDKGPDRQFTGGGVTEGNKSAHTDFESNREGRVENVLMFTFVVKIHPEQPINHIYIVWNGSTKEYNGRCSKPH